MVNQDLGIHAKLSVERLFGSHRKLSHRMNPHARQPLRRALAHAPKIGDGPMIPERRFVAFLGELPEEARTMLGGDVERDFGEIHVGAKPASGRYPCGLHDVIANAFPQLTGRTPIKLEVSCHIHESLVDRIDMDIVRRQVF